MSKVFVRTPVPIRVLRDFPSKCASPRSQRLKLAIERPLVGVCSRWLRKYWTRPDLPPVHLVGNVDSPRMGQAREGTLFSSLLQRTKKHISTPFGPRRLDARQWETKSYRPLRIKAQRMNVAPREEPEGEEPNVALFFLLFFVLFFSRFLQAYTSRRKEINHDASVSRASLASDPLLPFPLPVSLPSLSLSLSPSSALNLVVAMARDYLSLVPVVVPGPELVPRSETSARPVPLLEAPWAPLVLRSMLRHDRVFLKVLEGLDILVGRGRGLTGSSSIVRVDGGDMVQHSRAYRSVYNLYRQTADGEVLEPACILPPRDMVGVMTECLGAAEAFANIFWSTNQKASLLDSIISVLEGTDGESLPSGQMSCGEVVPRPRRVPKRTRADDFDLSQFICNEVGVDFEAAGEDDGETCDALDPAFIVSMFQGEELEEFMNVFGEIPGLVPDWDAVASATPLLPLQPVRGSGLHSLETLERRVANRLVRTDKPLDPAFLASVLDGDEIEEFMESFRHVKGLLPDREAVDNAQPVFEFSEVRGAQQGVQRP